METILPNQQTDPDFEYFRLKTEQMHDAEAAKPGRYHEVRANRFNNAGLLLRLPPVMLNERQKRELQVFLRDIFLSDALEQDLEADQFPYGPHYQRLQRGCMKLAGSLPFEAHPSSQQ